MTVRELLRNNLSSEELKLVPSAFDIIGSKEKSIAIIEIPKKLRKHRRLVAEAIIKKHKNVKSVLEKGSPRSGVFRIRKYRLLAGEKNTKVIHVESGCRFIIDPRKAYFSPREGTERLRIAEKVKVHETVMIFFAGAGPLAVVIGKKARPEKIIGIEINPAAVRFFKENIMLNKLKNVHEILGDVRDKANEFYGNCDRVIMPLPETAIEYLENALNCLKPKGICHLYCFCEEKNMKEFEKKIYEIASNLGKTIEIVDRAKVLPYGPRIWKMRFDIIMLS